MLSTEIFHPSKALWYRASICPRTSQDRCCNSISKPMRLSFNILMISKLLRLIRTSSNSGTSHSRSTICVCSNLMTPCNFSISIIRPRSCSFSASYTALSLLRSLDLSLASILGKTIAKFLDTQISRFQTGYSGFKLFKQVNFYKHFTHSSVTRQVVGVLTCPNTSLCLQDLLPTSACESSHLPTSLCLSPDKLSEFSLVQTPHLCLQDSLPTSACRDILKHFTKTCRFRQSIDKSHPSNDLTANMPKSETKHTSSESRILKLFDALDFTSAMYQPSVDCKSLV